MSRKGGITNEAFQEDHNTCQTSQSQNAVATSESEPLGDCSLFCFSCKPLNVFRGPKWFLVFLSVAAFMQGLCINGFVNVVITSIERRFGLQSTQTGMIASSYDLGSLVIMIPVSYLGGRAGASKPRWIGLGLLVMGLGSLVWTLPHFTSPAYITTMTSHDRTGDIGNQTQRLCGGSDNDDEAEILTNDAERSSSLQNYRYHKLFWLLTFRSIVFLFIFKIVKRLPGMCLYSGKYFMVSERPLLSRWA